MYLKANGYRSYRTEIEEFWVGLSNRCNSVCTSPELAAAAPAATMTPRTAMLYRIRQVHSGTRAMNMMTTAMIPVRETVDAMPAEMTMVARMAIQRRLGCRLKMARWMANGRIR